MTAERWQQVKAIFHDAADCDPAARAEFLRQRCGNDAELRREVESLLESEESPGTLLDNPVVGVGAMAAVAPTPVPLGTVTIGRVIGNYVVTGELARGGMGVVYRAKHVTLPREAVVKCIRPLALSGEGQRQMRARFRREAHIQSQLDHPNIVRVYEFFDLPEEYLLVMEYVSGASVRSILDNRGRLPAAEAVALTVQALQGLAHAHALHYVDEAGNTGTGIIHRDIKPGNLLVDEHGQVKLTDFGIAKTTGHDQLTQTGFNPGTVEYMSPEQIRGQPVDARSDLYSLGVTLYEMVAGRVPFPQTDSSSGYDLLKAHVETDAPPVRELNADISQALSDVIAKSLQRDPGQRWQTASEFRDALLDGQLVPKARRATVSRRTWVAGAAALFVALLAGGAVWLGRGGKATPSIAVLPFADMSPEKNQEYFSDGLAEELRNALAKTPGLRVAGSTSSAQFKNQTGDFSTIGSKLKVESILQGSVRRQGNRARITLQLIKSADGFLLWSESYDRELNDIFAVQAEIARAVTGALKVRLLGETAASSIKSVNVDAYNAYLQGRYFLARRNKQNLETAAGYFERAIALDERYAPAWAGLGESRGSQAMRDDVPREEAYRKARSAIERALSMDASLGEAYATLGRIKLFHDFDWVGADQSYQRALALEPGNARIIQTAGTLARALGRLQEAVDLDRRAIEIDPLSASGYHGTAIALYYAGLYDEAVVDLKKALELTPERDISHSMLAQVYLAQSKSQMALAEAQQEKHPSFRLCALALVYHALGQRKESDASLAELIDKLAADAPYQIAQVYAFRGEKDRAFEWLERAYQGHDGGLTEVKGDPLLKNLEPDPRYAAWLEKLHLPLR